LSELAFKLADDAARSAIECMCAPPPGMESKQPRWYDVEDLLDSADANTIKEAVEYLSGRDLLVFHAEDASLVRLVETGELDERIADSRPQLPSHLIQTIIRYGDARVDARSQPLGEGIFPPASALAEIVQSLRTWGAELAMDSVKAAAKSSRSPDLFGIEAAQREEGLFDQALQERDRYHHVADDLAGAIARYLGVEIGEHSSGNCPWKNALQLMNAAAKTKQPA
jgi:hypothetical protein